MKNYPRVQKKNKKEIDNLLTSLDSLGVSVSNITVFDKLKEQFLMLHNLERLASKLYAELNTQQSFSDMVSMMMAHMANGIHYLQWTH